MPRDGARPVRGQVAGSVNMPADGRFAETAGTVVTAGQEIVLVAPQDREEETVVRLARIGFDTVAGYLREPEGAFLAAPALVVRASRLTATELDEARHRDLPPVVVDVRNTGELIAGTIPGSINIPLAQLPHRLEEIPTDRPVVVHCAGGYRFSVAASLLRKQGWTDVSDLLGGYSAWTSTVTQPVG